MDITPLLPKGSQLIEAYGDGGFRVSSQRYNGSVLILPQQTLLWPVRDWTEIREEDFAPVLHSEPNPEMLVIGCGADFQMIPGFLKRLLFRQRGIAVEAMDTGAACRTYNVLMAEGRRVAAALVAV